MANMESVVKATVEALPDVRPSDAAAVELALMYAVKIDLDDDLIDKLGPKLLAALDALGATPKARKALTGKASTDDGAPRNPLADLNARRAERARVRRASAVDAPAS